MLSINGQSISISGKMLTLTDTSMPRTSANACWNLECGMWNAQIPRTRTRRQPLHIWVACKLRLARWIGLLHNGQCKTKGSGSFSITSKFDVHQIRSPFFQHPIQPIQPRLEAETALCRPTSRLILIIIPVLIAYQWFNLLDLCVPFAPHQVALPNEPLTIIIASPTLVE